MAAFGDLQHTFVRHLRAHIVVVHRHAGQGQQSVQGFQRHCGLLNAGDLCCDLLADLGEQLQLQSHRLLLCADDLLLDLLQLRCHIALAVGQGLLAGVAHGYHVVVGLGDFNVIAEHLVVLHAQVSDARLLTLALFQLDDPLFAAGGCSAVLIQHGAVTVVDDAALGDGDGRIGMDGTLQQGRQLLQRIKLLHDPAHRVAAAIHQQLTDAGYLLEGRAQRQAIAGIDGLVRHLGQQALHIVHALELLQQGHGQHMLAGKLLHRIQAALDLLLVDQRLLDPGTQQSSAHGGGRLVQQRQQRTFLVAAADGLRQLQIAPGVAIQQHGLAALVNAQLGDVLQRVFLGLGEVFHQRTRSAGSRLVLLRQAQGR